MEEARRERRTPRRMISILAMLALVAGMVALLAPGASAANKPTVNIAVSGTGTTSATITYTVNRQAKAISRTCTLDGNPTDCGTQSSSTKSSTTFQRIVTDPGDHTFSVTVRLTDGGSATGSVDFTVEPPASWTISPEFPSQLVFCTPQCASPILFELETVTNTGPVAIKVTSVFLQIPIETDDCSNSTLGPGESCTIQVAPLTTDLSLSCGQERFKEFFLTVKGAPVDGETVGSLTANLEVDFQSGC